MPHTPGPWTAKCRSCDGIDDPLLGWEILGPPDALRGQFALGDDARLIAAAPEMLTVLEKLMQSSLGNAVLDVCPEIDAVIAKAKGE